MSETTETRLSDEQEEAIDMCLDPFVRILSVTGRAGTGKTYVLGYAYGNTKDSGNGHGCVVRSHW